MLGDEPRNIFFGVKVTATEKRVWTKRAKAEKKTLGAWLLEPRRRELEA